MQFGDQEPGVEGIGQIEVAEKGHIVDLVGDAFVQQMTGYLEALKWDHFDEY